MRFLKKNQTEQSVSGWTIPTQAAAECAAGFVLIPFDGSPEQISPSFAELCHLEDDFTSVGDLIGALSFAGADVTAFKRMVDDLRQGKDAAPLRLTIAESCMLQLVPHLQKDAGGHPKTALIWAYDVTSVATELQQLQAENQKIKHDLRHYANMLNMAPYPIWQRDGELNVRYYNLAYGEIVEEFVSENTAAMPEMDRKERLLASQALQSGQPTQERRHLIVGGTRHLYQFSEMPVPEDQVVIGYAHDVTETEVMQEELQRHMSAQADLLESSASAMAIYGPDMRLKSFNYAFVALWRLDEAWLGTQPSYGEVLEALREKRKLPEQANFQMFKQQQQRLFTDLIDPREEFFYLPDGKTLRVIAIPHALGGILFAYEDVTDRLALERSYNTLIAVQRETLDNLHDGIAVYGEDGRLKLFNPKYLAMWNLSEDIAKQEPHIRDLIERVKNLYMFDDWEAFKQERTNHIQSRTPVVHRIERTDGKVLDCSTVPLPDGATLINYIDITDSTLVERSLRERNEALTQADHLKTEFLANVSYELRSPLTTIAGFSDMLRQQYFGTLTEKQKDYVEGIHTASEHLMHLINDILDLASIEAGFMQLSVDTFDIAAMLKSVLALVQERAKRHMVTIVTHIKPNIGRMLGDETRIKQCLFNLLSNALRFSNPGGQVILGASVDERDMITLFVEDDGPGIPAEEQPFVFDKFFKGSNPNVPKSKAKAGTGLGLAIVKNFIELHGGQVELHSDPSASTRFSCTLPRTNEALKPK